MVTPTNATGSQQPPVVLVRFLLPYGNAKKGDTASYRLFDAQKLVDAGIAQILQLPNPAGGVVLKSDGTH